MTYASPPADVSADIAGLQAALSAAGGVPSSTSSNLVVATWNLREFGQLVDAWQTAKSDQPQREKHAILCIAEIVRRFDVVAIQAAENDCSAMRCMQAARSDDWRLPVHRHEPGPRYWRGALGLPVEPAASPSGRAGR